MFVLFLQFCFRFVCVLFQANEPLWPECSSLWKQMLNYEYMNVQVCVCMRMHIVWLLTQRVRFHTKSCDYLIVCLLLFLFFYWYCRDIPHWFHSCHEYIYAAPLWWQLIMHANKTSINVWICTNFHRKVQLYLLQNIVPARCTNCGAPLYYYPLQPSHRTFLI